MILYRLSPGKMVFIVRKHLICQEFVNKKTIIDISGRLKRLSHLDDLCHDYGDFKFVVILGRNRRNRTNVKCSTS